MTTDRDQIILEVLNEVHAVTAYIEEFGGLTLGSPQWKSLRGTLMKLLEVNGGRTPVVPNEWPWPGREYGWGPTLAYANEEGQP